jgi:hypothetical protein
LISARKKKERERKRLLKPNPFVFHALVAFV